jgi:hypothetical protein
VEGYAYTQAGYVADGGTASITLPSGIQAGELLLCFCGAGSSVATVSAGGFTKLTLDFSAAWSNIEFSVFYKVAAGSDSLTLLNTGSGSGITTVAMRISNANTVNGVPTWGSDTSVNYPSATAGHPGKEYLFFVAASFTANYQISTPPTGYSDLLVGPTNSYGQGTSCASKRSSAMSDDPATLSFSGSASYEGATVVVYGV